MVKGGDFLYRWGNPQSYRQGLERDRKLYGQHFAHIIPEGLQDGGKIILFNNGNGRNPSFSEIFITDPVQDSPGFYNYTSNTAYGPEEPFYIYMNTDNPENFYSGILSSAQRLPNGSTLICEGINGHFFEINSENDIVWEYFSPVHNNTGTIGSQGDDPSSIANSCFRALKYPLNYEAFDGKDLTPGSPIENNSSSNVACSTLSLSQNESLLVSVYPNPTANTVDVQSNGTITSIIVHNMMGAKIMQTTSSSIDLSQQDSGVYFLTINSGQQIMRHKVIKK